MEDTIKANLTEKEAVIRGFNQYFEGQITILGLLCYIRDLENYFNRNYTPTNTST